MTKLQQFIRLKKQIKEKQLQAERIRGALEQSLAQLEEEFGVSTLEEARKIKARKMKKLKSQREVLNKKVESFLEKWKDQV